MGRAPIGTQIDRTRPIIENDDDSFSTERTITVQRDGKWYNVPTILDGKEHDPDEVQGWFESGDENVPHVGEFNTLDEAERAAVARSEEIGRVRGVDRESIMRRTAPPMQDDDGFGDFRAKVRGLPPEQRKAALTEMEQAIITNLRTNMLADLYDDQPPPAPGPGQPPQGDQTMRAPMQTRQPPTGDSELDSRLGRTPRDAVDFDTPEYQQFLKEYEDELRAGGMTPENDPQSWRAAMDEAYMQYNPQPRAPQPTRQPSPQGRGAMSDQDMRMMQGGQRPSIIDEPDPEALSMVQPTKFQQPPQGGRPSMSDQQLQDRGRTIMGPGGQQQPAWGSGDGFVDENDPDQPPYTSPLPRGSMRGKPYPSEREFGGGDAYYSQLYRWQKDNGAPEWQEGTNDGGPEWKSFVDEYHRKNNLPPPVDENKFREFVGRATGLSGQELYDVMLGHSDAVSQEEYDALLEQFRSQGKPNPRGAFGVPPGGKPTHPIGAY